MKNLIIIIAICLSTFSVKAQSILRDIDESGFALSGLFTNFEDGTFLGINGEYTIAGKTDLGMLIGFENSNSSDLSSTRFIPSISHLIIKQGVNEMPVSVRLNGSYSIVSFNRNGVSANAYSFGSTIYKGFELAYKISIHPGFNLSYSSSTLEISGFFEDTRTGVGYGLSAPTKIDKFFINPIISFFRGDSQFSIQIGYMF